MKKTALHICILLFILLLGFGFFLGINGPAVLFPALAGLWKEQTVVDDGASEYAICTDTGDRLCAAAAECLAHAVQTATGAELSICAERREVRPCIVLTVETAPPEAADALYAVELRDGDLFLRLYDREQGFALVRAFCETWLSADCGLKDGPDLVLDTRMLRRQLSGLKPKQERPIRVLTQNLRYNDDEGGNTIAERAPRFLQLVRDYQPDLIGTQEVTDEWLLDFLGKFADTYAVYGYPRDDLSNSSSEWNAILFRKDRFDCLGGSTFWLSETPEVVGSKLDYEGGHPRICTWALLRERETGKTLLFANTHLQNGNKKVFGPYRERQLQILFNVLRSGNNYFDAYPGVLTGDFNGTSAEAFYALATSVYRDSHETAIVNNSRVDYTIHNYGRESSNIIDYCFHSPGDLAVLDYQILDKDYGGYVSDHYGVMIDVILY